jgi:chromate reductase, NAD(P)H dehydrogenase (quinone)
MPGKKHILAISGSTRQASSNLNLIHASMELYSEKFDFTVFKGIADIPHFNPDLDTDNPPGAVADFRKQIKEADGVLICTPEYAMGVPGTLKNAIDWTVSTTVFSHKPVALITASSSGQKAHQSLLGTLRVIECTIPDSSQLLISFVKTKVKGDKITDAGTLDEVKKLMDSLTQTIEKNKERC